MHYAITAIQWCAFAPSAAVWAYNVYLAVTFKRWWGRA